MRAGRRYTCPRCGEQSTHAVRCFRCAVLPLDEHGHPPPPLFERQMLFRSQPPSEIGNDTLGQQCAGGGLAQWETVAPATLARCDPLTTATHRGRRA